jgi:hypothetical protein
MYTFKKTGTDDRTDCKYIGLYSGWNQRKSGFGRVLVTYLKVNSGLGPNGPRVGPGKILTLRPLQTSSADYFTTGE